MSYEKITPGDKLAHRIYDRWRVYGPRVTYAILTVERITATLLICTDREGREVRVSRKRGTVVGSYETVSPATPEILAQNEAEWGEVMRWSIAVTNTNDLIGRPLHQLKLTTAQLERLAASWAEVKAMGSKT